MSNIEQIRTLATKIQDASNEVMTLTKDRDDWTKPDRKTMHIGGRHIHVVCKSGATHPMLREAQIAVVKAIDIEIIKAKSRLEGLAHQLSKLVKSGVVA